MGNRQRRSEQEEHWHTWLNEHSQLVESARLPTAVLADYGHWLDFLDHGSLDHHHDPSRFTLEDLSIRQKAGLLRLISTWPDMLQTIVGAKLIIDMVDAVEQRYKD